MDLYVYTLDLGPENKGKGYFLQRIRVKETKTLYKAEEGVIPGICRSRIEKEAIPFAKQTVNGFIAVSISELAVDDITALLLKIPTERIEKLKEQIKEDEQNIGIIRSAKNIAEKIKAKDFWKR